MFFKLRSRLFGVKPKIKKNNNCNSSKNKEVMSSNVIKNIELTELTDNSSKLQSNKSDIPLEPVKHPPLATLIARAESSTAKIDPAQYNKVLLREEIVSFMDIAQIQNYIILDFETTGLQAQDDRITEFCIQLYSNDKMSEEFCEMVNPRKPISEIVTRKTGITNAMLADKKDISAYLDKIVNMVNHRVVVGHNVKFDLDFLASELLRNKYNGEPLKVKFVDTLKLSRKKIPNAPNHKLETLKKLLHIDVISHRAGADCFVTNELFLHLKSK